MVHYRLSIDYQIINKLFVQTPLNAMYGYLRSGLGVGFGECDIQWTIRETELEFQQTICKVSVGYMTTVLLCSKAVWALNLIRYPWENGTQISKHGVSMSWGNLWGICGLKKKLNSLYESPSKLQNSLNRSDNWIIMPFQSFKCGTTLFSVWDISQQQNRSGPGPYRVGTGCLWFSVWKWKSLIF